MTGVQPELADEGVQSGPAGEAAPPSDEPSDVPSDATPEPEGGADPTALEVPPGVQHPPSSPVFRVMEVDDVSLDLPSQYPAVTLVECEPPLRELVFPVGLPEGTAMAQALRRVESWRPMTHELFMRVLQRARIDVVAVRLTGREEGNLLAELDLMTPAGRERVDCRPSDGIVLALRMPVPAPILVDERLLEDHGDVAPGTTEGAGSDEIGA